MLRAASTRDEAAGCHASDPGLWRALFEAAAAHAALQGFRDLFPTLSGALKRVELLRLFQGSAAGGCHGEEPPALNEAI